MANNGDMCQSLIEWFQTIKLEAPHNNAEEISDGVALAQALNQFAPDSFSDEWLSKIKKDGSNWRLKMSNIKKVIEGVYDFYDVLNYSLTNFIKPDAQLISEKVNLCELERLLQLVLGCAVNCEAKHNYIRQIMCLEESLQQNIMRALQELESTWQNDGNIGQRNMPSLSNFENRTVQHHEALAQKCFEIEKKLHSTTEEKTNLQHEVSKLQLKIEQLEATQLGIGDDGVSIGPVQCGSSRYSELRRQLDVVKEALLQSETTREELKLKNNALKTELINLQEHVVELNKNKILLVQLKDEVDVLRESNDKLKICEAQLAIYKKKLEEFNDLKKQVFILGERNAEYSQQNVQFEENTKKCAGLKSQAELLKNEVQELQFRLDSELTKNVKNEIEYKNLENNMNALQRSKETLLKERDNLREIIDEIKCGQLQINFENLTGNAVSKELEPSALIEKIEVLQAKHKSLKEVQSSKDALSVFLDDTNKHNENLREQLKSANEQILSLSHTSHIEDTQLTEQEYKKQLKRVIELNEQKTIQIEEYASQNAIMQNNIRQLESTLLSRDQDIQANEAKHKKWIEKAKEIVKNLDPRSVASIDGIFSEKSQFTSEDQKKRQNTFEEELLSTAFYRYSINAERDAVHSKLAMLMGQNQTFLARQRQIAPRNSMLKSK